MAAKKTAEIIPLCHNISLSGIDVDCEIVLPPESHVESRSDDSGADLLGNAGSVDVSATVRTFGQTGVEMEALTAASAAALTVYDMCKAIDRGMLITDLRVVMKTGGASGDWKNSVRVDGAENKPTG